MLDDSMCLHLEHVLRLYFDLATAAVDLPKLEVRHTTKS